MSTTCRCGGHALVTTMALSQVPASTKATNMRYLEYASEVLKDLSRTYPMAWRMSAVVDTAISELGERLSIPNELLPMLADDKNEVDGHGHSADFNPRKRCRVSNYSEREALVSDSYANMPAAKRRQGLVDGNPPSMSRCQQPPNSVLSGSHIAMAHVEQAENLTGIRSRPRSVETLSAFGRDTSPTTYESGFATPKAPSPTELQRPVGGSERDGHHTAGQFRTRSPGNGNRMLDRLHRQSLFPTLTGLDFLSILSGKMRDDNK